MVRRRVAPDFRPVVVAVISAQSDHDNAVARVAVILKKKKKKAFGGRLFQSLPEHRNVLDRHMIAILHHFDRVVFQAHYFVVL